jgi:tetrahydromethanopterin S-methyltransferase subunit B
VVPQVIKMLEVLICSEVLSMNPQSSKAVLDWWWIIFLVIVVAGLATSNEYLILIGLVLMVIAAILTYTMRHRRTQYLISKEAR